jgi:rubrerythrin
MVESTMAKELTDIRKEKAMAALSPHIKRTIPAREEVDASTAGVEVKTLEEALNFAVDEGTRTYEYYMELAVRVKDRWAREAFESFAAEELGHIERFVAVRQSPRATARPCNVPSLKLAEYVNAEVWPHENMDTREAYVVALKAESTAYQRYLDLADNAATRDIQGVFLALAEEVAKHRLKLEMEYDDYVFAQN